MSSKTDIWYNRFMLIGLFGTIISCVIIGLLLNNHKETMKGYIKNIIMDQRDLWNASTEIIVISRSVVRSMTEVTKEQTEIWKVMNEMNKRLKDNEAYIKTLLDNGYYTLYNITKYLVILLVTMILSSYILWHYY
jgi:putative flippase GtrA